MRNFIFCVAILLAAAPLRAQVTPAWTRQLNPVQWQELTRGVASPRAKGAVRFLDLSRRINAAQTVKTTDKNWLRHKVFYSGVFSRQEKDILLAPAHAQAVLGKVVYLHNKHAAFYNQLTNRYAQEHINVKAFERHQEILRQLAATLQQYYLQQNPMIFASSVFSKEEIQKMQQLPAQPAAYVLTPKELAEFASLPSKEGQQYWTQRHIYTAQWDAESLLLKQTYALSSTDFENYYFTHARLSYFQLLAQNLERRTEKRSSAIMRYKLPLSAGETPLTDAQRGGKLLFEKTDVNDPSIKEFKQNYGPYAAAEALNAPYEIALQYGENAPELLGMREGERLRRLETHDCLEEVLPKIAELETQLASLRRQTPADDDFYKTYYAVHTRLEIYQTLAARARFMLHF